MISISKLLCDLDAEGDGLRYDDGRDSSREQITEVADESEHAMQKEAENVGGEISARISQLINEEVSSLRAYLDIRSAGNNSAGLLATAANVDTVEDLKNLEARFQESANDIIMAINTLGYGDETKAVREQANALVSLGQGEDSVFALRRRQLEAQERARAALERSRDLLDAGVIEGENMLPGTAKVKLMWALANADDPEETMREPLAGELTQRSVPWE